MIPEGMTITEFEMLCQDIEAQNCLGWALNDTLYLFGFSSLVNN